MKNNNLINDGQSMFCYQSKLIQIYLRNIALKNSFKTVHVGVNGVKKSILLIQLNAKKVQLKDFLCSKKRQILLHKVREVAFVKKRSTKRLREKIIYGLDRKKMQQL
ncbi:unnamed protein product (macronuclear) [Paramecium tetraurelia]|uniref:Uncharacterized protein n=1 Tax=Paramecium tetraurelia TaxID=5888 RepID=A0C253_PARTE|nr:uncharacterized protein GSPATT00034347001 [Paramecium tetraurelia]CAK64870.1 unnamed protein product [Paramecium tetraurelia]|eukprot:XP_001432267.1 hypothetical protein (macronuclear) [Paramecium tetraurelia strain d4-2]